MTVAGDRMAVVVEHVAIDPRVSALVDRRAVPLYPHAVAAAAPPVVMGEVAGDPDRAGGRIRIRRPTTLPPGAGPVRELVVVDEHVFDVGDADAGRSWKAFFGAAGRTAQSQAGHARASVELQHELRLVGLPREIE